MVDNEDKPLGLGLIGCGAFGLFCLDIFSRMEQVRPVAVADIRENVAADFARDFGIRSFTDPTALIALEEVDVVHIATPPSTHYELARQAIEAGKHVLCKQPLTVRLDEADELLKAAWDAGRIAPVNFILRYNHVSKAVKRLIESGVLGSVLAGQLTHCAGDSGLHPGHWFWEKSVSGGIFIEHGVHFFDLYRQWLGPGEVVSAHTETRPGTSQEDRVMCTIRHDDGAVIHHYHGFDQMSIMDRTNHRLVCERGDVWIDGWIPLHLTIDAAVDETGRERIADCLPDADLRVLEEYDADHREVFGRGEKRHVAQRLHAHWCPSADKQRVYADSVRDLLADQIAFLRDRSHHRDVIEINGREALALAESARCIAEGS
jgi:predicted dehydrogenase